MVIKEVNQELRTNDDPDEGDEEVKDDEDIIEPAPGPVNELRMSDWTTVRIAALPPKELRDRFLELKCSDNESSKDAILSNIAEAFLLYLEGNQPWKGVVRSVWREVFSYYDVLSLLPAAADKHLHLWKKPASWEKLLKFISTIDWNGNFPSFRKRIDKMKAVRRLQLAKVSVEKVLLNMTQCKLPHTVEMRLLNWLTDHWLPVAPSPHLFAQYFFSSINGGFAHAISSLGGIFSLVVNHDFDHPSIWKDVYRLTQPSALYCAHNRKFLALLDRMMSSTHVSLYIVASFSKRLSRLALFAPFDIQETLLSFIRNLITRHSNIASLIHRDNPDTLESDPFVMEEEDLSQTKALQSSLWEFKTLQRHFLLDVAKRARCVDKGAQQTESFVRPRDAGDYWAASVAETVPNLTSNLLQPHSFFPDTSFLFDYENVWNLN